MNKQLSQWLLPTTFLLLFTGTATAQTVHRHPVPSKQSHYDLPDGLNPAQAQAMMAQRLQKLRQLHQMQDQVQELLNNREFLDGIKNQMSEDKLRQLREDLFEGRSLGQVGDLNRLLRQTGSQPKLDQRQLDTLLRFFKSVERKPSANGESAVMSPTSAGLAAPPPTSASTDGEVTSVHPPPLSFPARAAPQPSLLERMQEDTTNWLVENFDDLDDAIEALSRVGKAEEVAPFAELLRASRQHDFSGMSASEPVRELSRRLSDVSGFFHRQGGEWIEEHSHLYAALPSLSQLPTPAVSVPSSAAADSDAWVPALLSVLMLGAFVLFLCKWGIVAPAQGGEGEEWRLGSWPVSPSGVSTRQDVIRAFEHLVLLRLGSAVGVCHHLDLAERLAAQDSGNPARRQAAEMLAWLYEQARYAPADETLSQGQLADARHALCFLAGVKSA